MHPYRTHTCNELRASDAGKTVRLSGWMYRLRDHGGILFVDLRDHHGLTQIVVHPSRSFFAQVEKAHLESVITVTGATIYDSGRAPMGYALYYTSGQSAAVALTYGSALPTGDGVTWAQLPGNPATIAGQTASKYITVALVDVVTGKVVAGGNTTMLVKA